MMQFLLAVDSVSIVDPDDVQTSKFCTDSFVDSDGDQYIQCLKTERFDQDFMIDIDLGKGLKTTGASSEKTVGIVLSQYTNDEYNLTSLNRSTRSIFGQRAYLIAIGAGGDGTEYTINSPFVIIDGTISNVKWVGTSHLQFSVNNNSSIFRANLPNKKIIGYDDGLLYNGSTSQVEITGYTDIPDEFTAIALVLIPRSLGSNSINTIYGQNSVHCYFENVSSTVSRKINFRFRNDTDTAWITYEGPTVDRVEDFYTLSWSYSYITRKLRIGVNTEFEEYDTTGAFQQITGAWKIGRLKTSTATTCETIISGMALITNYVSNSKLRSYVTNRLSGNEDGLAWFFPGSAIAGMLVDHASVNDESPLNGTITGATFVAALNGSEELAGTIAPRNLGVVKNVTPLAADPKRKIYKVGDNLSTVLDFLDRSTFYNVASRQESIIGFINNPPSFSGDVTICDFAGGVIAVHTEVSGVQNTVDLIGPSIWDHSISVGFDYSNSQMFWDNFDFVAFFDNPPWSFEININCHGDPSDNDVVIVNCEWWKLTWTPVEDENRALFTVTVYTTGLDMVVQYYEYVNSSHFLKIDAWEEGSDAKLRVYIEGSFVGSDIAKSSTLHSNTGMVDFTIGMASITTPIQRITFLPIRMWSNVESSIEDAELFQRQYLFKNPESDATNLFSLFYRYDTSRLILVDETTNNRDGTVDLNAHWGPGVGATNRLTLAYYLLTTIGGLEINLLESAYNFDRSPLSYPLTEPLPLIDIAANILQGGGLFLLVNTDNTCTIGQVTNPNDEVDPDNLYVNLYNNDDIEYDWQPSNINLKYSPNPTVQTNSLPGAITSRRSFAEKEHRELDQDIEENRKLYNDVEYPDGRVAIIDTWFTNKRPVRDELERLIDIHNTPRYTRTFSHTPGFTSILPGSIKNFIHDRILNGSRQGIVVKVRKQRTQDVIVVSFKA